MPKQKVYENIVCFRVSLNDYQRYLKKSKIEHHNMSEELRSKLRDLL